MKKFTKILPYVVVIVLGVGFFYGMAFAQFGTTQGQTLATQWQLGGGQGNLITVIKTFINWILGLLSLVALVMLLFGGFKMVTAAGNETKYKEGFKVLKQAAIGLAVIGLSWLIVSFIFLLIGGTAENNITVQ